MLNDHRNPIINPINFPALLDHLCSHCKQIATGFKQNCAKKTTSSRQFLLFIREQQQESLQLIQVQKANFGRFHAGEICQLLRFHTFVSTLAHTAGRGSCFCDSWPDKEAQGIMFPILPSPNQKSMCREIRRNMHAQWKHNNKLFLVLVTAFYIICIYQSQQYSLKIKGVMSSSSRYRELRCIKAGAC